MDFLSSATGFHKRNPQLFTDHPDSLTAYTESPCDVGISLRPVDFLDGDSSLSVLAEPPAVHRQILMPDDRQPHGLIRQLQPSSRFRIGKLLGQ